MEIGTIMTTTIVHIHNVLFIFVLKIVCLISTEKNFTESNRIFVICFLFFSCNVPSELKRVVNEVVKLVLL